jgi:mannosyl-3-phosphoglycerate phosphatase
MPSFIVYSDIDGTFADANYSYKKALPALELLKKKEIPLIFCTSKTRAEIEVYRQDLGIKDPFISENGGGIYIPKDYFREPTGGVLMDDYMVIELGTPYSRLKEILEGIKNSAGCEIVGFGDMSAEEIAEDSGLDLKSAKLAKEREYDEPFRIKGTGREIEKTLKLIESHKLNYTKGGRYYHITGDNDKGKAVRILTGFYIKENPGIKSIGLGDGYNDIPMLENVDFPVLIKRPDGTHIEFKKATKSGLIGPEGWNEVVSEMFL